MRQPTYKRPSANRVTETTKSLMMPRDTVVNQNYDKDDDYQDDVYDYEEVSAEEIRDFYASKREFEEGKGTPYEFG